MATYGSIDSIDSDSDWLDTDDSDWLDTDDSNDECIVSHSNGVLLATLFTISSKMDTIITVLNDINTSISNIKIDTQQDT